MAKLDVLDATTCPYFTIGLDDIQQDFMMWTIPTSLLSTATWSTITLNIISQGLPVTGLGNGNYFDLSKVCSWIFAGDYGMTTGAQQLDMNFRIDDISTAGSPNSKVTATGSVSLNGATLGAAVSAGFTPTTGQQFTIIDKTSAGAVSGTFTGWPEGHTGTISGHSYSITYTGGGGDNNNVILTKVPDAVDVDPPVLDLDGTGAGSPTNFTTNWSNAGAVYVTAAGANLTDDDSTDLSSVTVALASPHAGDTLTADTTGTSITATFLSNTLTLSGADTVADYQQVLRTIQYNNTSPPLGVNTVTLNFSATDAASNVSTTQTTTIDVAPVLDLNGGAGGTSFTSSWSGFGAIPVAITDAAAATVTDAGLANLTQLTATLTTPHAGDTLSANNTGHTAIAVSFASNVLTLSGSDTVANYQAVLRTIKYTNSSGGPLVDSLTVDLQASDGTLLSNVATATVQFPPVLDLNGGAGGSGNTTNWYNSGAVGVNAPDDATVLATSGLTNLTGITVVESSFHTGDVLAMTAINGITGLSQSYSAGTLSITGSNSVANYQKILRLISYNNTAGGPGVSSFTASVTATDGTLTSVAQTATINSTVLSGQVLGNRLFYNNSKYDNNGAGINSVSDNLAIASDKIGFTGTGTATYNNVSAFSKGITGVMIDLQSGLGTHGSLALTDFTFKVSGTFSFGTYNNIASAAWSTGPTPSGFSVLLGGGTGGSDRVEITWNTNDIKNKWLEVKLASGGNSGLTSPDIFFFGSAVGDSGQGNSASQITVNATDVTEQRNNISPAFGSVTPLWNPADYDKSGVVNASDGTVSSGNTGFVLHFIANVTNAAPSSGDSGISSGLAATSSSSTTSTSSSTAPAWLVDRLASAGDLNSGEIADYFRQLAAEGSEADKEVLVEADQAAEELGLNDDVLDGLLADLGLV